MCSVLATRKTAEKVRKVPLAVNLLAVKSAVYTTKNTRDKTPVRILTVNKITPCTRPTLGNQFDTRVKNKLLNIDRHKHIHARSTDTFNFP